MKILAFSDTHGDTETAIAVARIVRPDALLHMGDHVSDAERLAGLCQAQTAFVAGNTDPEGSAPEERMIELAGRSFFLAHGHRYDVEYGISGLARRAREKGAEVVLFGHTHRPFAELRDGVWFINPGRGGFSASRRICATCAVITCGPGFSVELAEVQSLLNASK